MRTGSGKRIVVSHVTRARPLCMKGLLVKTNVLVSVSIILVIHLLHYS